MSAIPEFMVRVKLPSSNSYASCPSGDTEYEGAYSKALAKALPDGFEYIRPRQGTKWPMDSEGWTWARLKCCDEKVAIAHWMSRALQLEKRLRNIKADAKALAKKIAEL